MSIIVNIVAMAPVLTIVIMFIIVIALVTGVDITVIKVSIKTTFNTHINKLHNPRTFMLIHLKDIHVYDI